MISQISDTEKNIDVSKILNTIGSDTRIGKKYLSLGAIIFFLVFVHQVLSLIQFLKKSKTNYSLPRATDNVKNMLEVNQAV